MCNVAPSGLGVRAGSQTASRVCGGTGQLQCPRGREAEVGLLPHLLGHSSPCSALTSHQTPRSACCLPSLSLSANTPTDPGTKTPIWCLAAWNCSEALPGNCFQKFPFLFFRFVFLMVQAVTFSGDSSSSAPLQRLSPALQQLPFLHAP